MYADLMLEHGAKPGDAGFGPNWYDSVGIAAGCRSKWGGKNVHPPRELRPNLRGAFDMHGNLFEWTHTGYGDYDIEANSDPQDGILGANRVVRGGSKNDVTANCRAACCITNDPTNRTIDNGF